MASELPEPRKVVTYPVGSDPNVGAVFLFGDANAPNMALLCAGFPDDHEIFLPFASRLATETKCLVGVTCLPGYDDREDRPYTVNKPEGYSFDEWVVAIREAFKILKAESTCPTVKVTGIFHDWGVLAGSLYANRTLEESQDDSTNPQSTSAVVPNQLVLFDVLMPPHPKMENKPVARKDTLYETIVTLSYRIILAAGFGIRRFVSKALAQVFTGLGFAGLGLLRISPSYELDMKIPETRKKPISLDRMVYMAYPYYYLLKTVFVGNPKQDLHGCSIPLDLTKMPVLYMYGTHKRINFHDRSAIMVLENEEKEGRKSKVVPVDNAGHWLYVQQPDICFAEVKKFIEDA